MKVVSEVYFTIVICSYNPDDRLLQRCLNAVSRLAHHGFGSEVLLVDNNSNPPLANRLFVQDFLNTKPDSKIIVAEQQGLVYARIVGISQAKGEYLVFFDDDNEPQSDYLIEIHALNQRYPAVAAWGPGTVPVDFVDGIDSRIKEVAYGALQGKRENYTAFACLRQWQACYPFGTGLCIKANVLAKFMEWFNAGKLTATGRNGVSLASGEDLQMVMTCIALGYAAGHSPRLQVVHVIPGKRADMTYIKRLSYGSNLAFHTSIAEVLPEYAEVVNSQLHRPRRFAFKSAKRYLSALLTGSPAKMVNTINYIGAMSSLYRLYHLPVPKIVTAILKHAKLL
ncbi:glycosyltransferase [Parapedobacter koreensis]|uniref:Glycosyl transferase family 2 n=1 Tax=Parapedobacter koreensis TaxID=332977 RepID=A0A1H7GG07_9SPHI|nr:glycosyltransferase [Parapedobacter koreensis]SEK35842.1 Glycosyl transferase family 2 [Parapedobacter koreensis]